MSCPRQTFFGFNTKKGKTMEFIKTKNGLKITIDDADKKFLKELSEDNHNVLCTRTAEYDFFESYLCNSDWEWINPEDIAALTDAPILGIRDENNEVTEAYGYMDYQVYSMLEELEIHGEIFLQKG